MSGKMMMILLVVLVIPFLLIDRGEKGVEAQIWLLIMVLPFAAMFVWIMYSIRRRGKRGHAKSNNFHNFLASFGVSSQLSGEKRYEENIGKPKFHTSYGIIDINDGPIKWAQVTWTRGGRYGEILIEELILAIPDKQPVIDGKGIEIKTIKHKSIPIFGKTTNVTWRGNDNGKGLIWLLTEDVDVKQLIMATANTRIKWHGPQHAVWTISQSYKNYLPVHWQTFQKIANLILSTSKG